MFRFYILIIFLFISTLNAYSNSKSELLIIFSESIKVDSLSDLNVKKDVTSLIDLYENNQLSEKQRFLFYKSIINLHEIRKWDDKLKSIVLIKFVKYDAENQLPAYKMMEASRSAFMDMVNVFMQEEFGFLENIKENIKKDLISKGEYVERVVLDEDQINEAIRIVYERLISEENALYLY